jgi:hypothetical protein
VGLVVVTNEIERVRELGGRGGREWLVAALASCFGEGVGRASGPSIDCREIARDAADSRIQLTGALELHFRIPQLVSEEVNHAARQVRLGQRRVQRDGVKCGFSRQPVHRATTVRSPIAHPHRGGVQVSHLCVGSGVHGIERNRLLEQSDRGEHRRVVPQQHGITRANVQLVSRDVVRLTCRAPARESHAQLSRDRADDRVLDGEDVAQLAVIRLGPVREPGRCINESDCDAKA